MDSCGQEGRRAAQAGLREPPGPGQGQTMESWAVAQSKRGGEDGQAEAAAEQDETSLAPHNSPGRLTTPNPALPALHPKTACSLVSPPALEMLKNLGREPVLSF